MCGTCLQAQLLKGLKWEDPLSPDVQGRPGEYSKTPSQNNGGRSAEHSTEFSCFLQQAISVHLLQHLWRRVISYLGRWRTEESFVFISCGCLVMARFGPSMQTRLILGYLWASTALEQIHRNRQTCDQEEPFIVPKVKHSPQRQKGLMCWVCGLGNKCPLSSFPPHTWET